MLTSCKVKQNIILLSLFWLALGFAFIQSAKAGSLTATYEGGIVSLFGSESAECDLSDLYENQMIAIVHINNTIPPLDYRAYSSGLSISVDTTHTLICQAPGTYTYTATYAGGMVYEYESFCRMSTLDQVTADVDIPLWPDINITEPVGYVDPYDLIDDYITFSYSFAPSFDNNRYITLDVGNVFVFYDEGLQASGSKSILYDFSNHSGFVLLQVQSGCGGNARFVEKLVYVEPEDSCDLNVGKPVSVASGTVYISETDFSIKGIAPLSFTRYYDSGEETINRDFGKSWSHSYDTRLVQFPYSLNTYIVIDPDGSRTYYIDNDKDNIYDVEFPKGSNSRLIKDPADSSFLREFTEGKKEEFNSQGYLTAIEDRNGNRTEITRTLNLIDKITGPIGREISITYTSGKISSTTLPDNRGIAYEYYTSGYLKKVTYPDQTFREYEYTLVSGVGYRLTGIKDENNNYVEKHTYDSLGRAITSSADGINDLLTIDYIDSTHTTVTDSLGRVTTYTIDKSSGQSHATNISGPGCAECGQSNISRTYDDNLNVTSETDGNGNVTNMTYDSSGNMLIKTEAVGTTEERTTTYTYNSFGQVLSITDSDSNTTAYTYDTNGNLIQEKDAQANITSHTYGTYNEKFSTTDRNGNTTTYTYDVYGNLTSVTNALGQTITYTYDIMGNLQSMTDANGNITYYEYDLRDRLIKEIKPDGGEINYEYDAAGNRTAVTDANGNRTIFTYDAINRLITTTDPEGNTMNYTYDTEGNITSMTIRDSLNNIMTTTTYTYDDHNRLVRTTHADATYAEQSYDSLGNVLTKRDENGNITNYAYNALNRLVSVTDPALGVTSYSYDSRDNLLTVTDANSNTTTYTYDSLNRLISITSSDTGTTTYAYDANGNMITKTDTKGTTTTYVYDELNRQTAVQYPDSTQNITYTHDAPSYQNSIGRLATMTDPSGSTTYDYDSMGRVTKEFRNVSGLNYSTDYSYDLNGNLIMITYPGGRQIAYTYNQLNKVASVAETKYGVTNILADNILYLPFGDIESMTQGNGIITTKTYDNRYQLSDLNNGTTKNISYTRASVGNITDIADNIDPAKTKSYTYDNLYRLTMATGPWGTITYAYDPVGNRTYETTDTGNTTYNYALNTNKLSSTAGEKALSFGYDSNGNTTTENSKQFIYNQNQRLTQAVEGSDVIGEYIYNGNGQRVKKFTDNGTRCTVYHYDKYGMLIAESSSSGTIKAEYINVNGQPLAKIEGNNIYYYHNDHLGSPMLMTDSSGATVWQGEFLPFGEVHSISGSVTNNLRFPGQYYDSETGLHYNYFRDYKPEIGRYVEADPIGLDGTNHLYLYVGNNPINWVDPWGLMVCDTICTLIPVPLWAAPVCDIVCPTELPEPVTCTLIPHVTETNGNSKRCYYDCTTTGWKEDIDSITVPCEEECPSTAPFGL